MLEPLDLMARLAALVPPPRMQLTRSTMGCSRSRSRPARCGGNLKIIASIEEPTVIARILSHLERTAPKQNQSALPRQPSADARRYSALGQGRAESGHGQRYLPPAGVAAGRAGRQVCRSRPADRRPRLTRRPATRTRIVLDRCVEAPIRRRLPGAEIGVTMRRCTSRRPALEEALRPIRVARGTLSIESPFRVGYRRRSDSPCSLSANSR